MGAPLAHAIIVVAVLAFCAFVIWIGLQADRARKKILFEARMHLLDKLGSGSAAAQFLATEEGREFLRRFTESLDRLDKPVKQQKVNAIGAMFFMITIGVIVTAVGVGLFVGAAVRDPILVVPGALCASAGLGLLLAVAITHYLATKWVREKRLVVKDGNLEVPNTPVS